MRQPYILGVLLFVLTVQSQDYWPIKSLFPVPPLVPYNFGPAIQCSGNVTVTATGDVQLFTDHFGPTQYSVGVPCDWIFTAAPAQKIFIRFLDFSFSGYVAFNTTISGWDKTTYFEQANNLNLIGNLKDESVEYWDPLVKDLFEVPPSLSQLIEVPSGTRMRFQSVLPPASTAKLGSSYVPDTTGITFIVSLSDPSTLIEPASNLSFSTSSVNETHGTFLVKPSGCTLNNKCVYTFSQNDLGRSDFVLFVSIKAIDSLTNMSLLNGHEWEGRGSIFEVGFQENETLHCSGSTNQSFLVIDWWFQKVDLMETGNLVKALPFAKTGIIRFPETGFYVPEETIQVWTLRLPPLETTFFYFDYFLFSNLSTTISFNIPTNTSFEPILVETSYFNIPQLVVIHPQAKSHELSIELTSPGDGGGFRLNWVVGFKLFSKLGDVTRVPTDVEYINISLKGPSIIAHEVPGHTFTSSPTWINQAVQHLSEDQGSILSPETTIPFSFRESKLEYLFMRPISSVSGPIDEDKIQVDLVPEFEKPHFSPPEQRFATCTTQSNVCVLLKPVDSKNSVVILPNLTRNQTVGTKKFLQATIPTSFERLSVYICQEPSAYNVFVVDNIKSEFSIYSTNGEEEIKLLRKFRDTSVDMRVFGLAPDCSLLVVPLITGGIRTFSLTRSADKSTFSIESLKFFSEFTDTNYNDTVDSPISHLFFNRTHVLVLGMDMDFLIRWGVIPIPTLAARPNVIIDSPDDYDTATDEYFDSLPFFSTIYGYLDDEGLDDLELEIEPSYFSATMSENGRYIALGFKDGQEVVVIKVDGNTTLTAKYCNETNTSKLLMPWRLTWMVRGDKVFDQYFGRQVGFSNDGDVLYVIGDKIYFVNVPELYSPTNKEPDPQWIYFRDLGTHVLPNRFTKTPAFFSTLTLPTTRLSFSRSLSDAFLAQVTPSGQVSSQSLLGAPSGNELLFEIETNQKDGSEVDVRSLVQKCLPGFYKSLVGFTPCSVCAVNRYQDGSNDSYCSPCPQDSYCPAGAARPLYQNLKAEYDRPKFTENSSQGIENEVFKPFITEVSNTPVWASLVLVIWIGLVLLGLFFVLAPFNEDAHKISKPIKKFLRDHLDDEMDAQFDPDQGKVVSTGSSRDALVYAAKTTFLVIVLIYCFFFFFSYDSSFGKDAYDQKILNNQRQSVMKPKFTRDSDTEDLLRILAAHKFKISISFRDLRGRAQPEESCNWICSDRAVTIKSSGCFMVIKVNNTDVFKDCLTDFHTPKINTTGSFCGPRLGDPSFCDITIDLPAELILQDTATFTVNVGNSFFHEVNVSIVQPHVNQSTFEPPSSESGGKEIFGLTATDTVVAAKDGTSILYKNTRTFEMTPVIQQIDARKFTVEPPSRWVLSTVFVPKESQSLDGEIISYEKFMAADPVLDNSFTIRFTQSNYFVLNSEHFATNIGDLILQLVLIVGTVIGFFDVLLVIFEFLWRMFKLGIVYIHRCQSGAKPEEDPDGAVSPRSKKLGLTTKFNPYNQEHFQVMVRQTLRESGIKLSAPKKEKHKKRDSDGADEMAAL